MDREQRLEAALRNAEQQFHDVRMAAERWTPDMTPATFANVVIHAALIGRNACRAALGDQEAPTEPPAEHNWDGEWVQ